MRERYQQCKKIYFIICIAAFLTPSVSQAQQSNLCLWYTSPARQWESSLPLGNGRLGAMPDGGVAHENIVLNDITLWSGSKQNADDGKAYLHLPEIRSLLLAGKNVEAQRVMSKYFKCAGKGSGNGDGANVPYGSYQVLGDMGIDYGYGADSIYKPANYKRKLLLDSAMALTTYIINKTTYRREYIASFNDDVIAVKLSASDLKKINFILFLTRPERFKTITKNGVLQMWGNLNNGNSGKGMGYAVTVKIKQYGGNINYRTNAITVNKADSAIIYIAAATSFFNKNYEVFNQSVLKAATRKSYGKQLHLHVKNFQRLFNKVSLHIAGNGNENLPTDQRLKAFETDLGDNQLPALYYQYGRYLAISSTRVGLLPPNLQGLWANTIHTPWNGDYHLDINIQMNKWPLEEANLGKLNEPYLKLVAGLVSPGQKTAKAYYNANGWVAHVITNIWGYTSPGEDYSWGAYNTGSAWLCQMLYTHYQYTGDVDYLRKLYPIIKGSAVFYLDMLVKEPTHGWLVTAPSNSPENAFIMKNGDVANVCIGPTIDNQLLRYLFNAAINASNVLNTDSDFRARLFKAIKQLPPNQVGKDGRLMEWLEVYKEPEPHHRHTSHLWGLYPGSEITVDDTLLAKATEASLRVRGDEGTGWSLAWKMNFWARLHDGDHALLLFHKLVRPVTSSSVNMSNGGGSYSNLFCAHPPFQIDGNFGGTAGIGEMLLQSQKGYIELLPALPQQWQTGSFTGFRARKGLEIGVLWQKHMLRDLTVKSDFTQVVKIKLPVNINIKQINTKGKRISYQIVNNYLMFRLDKNNEAIIKFRS